jgi:predicted TPR repeat methyltransferase
MSLPLLLLLLLQCVELKPDWAKGYSRLGAAYYGLQEWENAIKAYEDGEQQQQEQRAACMIIPQL